jgi:hypothetical protein
MLYSTNANEPTSSVLNTTICLSHQKKIYVNKPTIWGIPHHTHPSQRDTPVLIQTMIQVKILEKN